MRAARAARRRDRIMRRATGLRKVASLGRTLLKKWTGSFLLFQYPIVLLCFVNLIFVASRVEACHCDAWWKWNSCVCKQAAVPGAALGTSLAIVLGCWGAGVRCRFY